MHTVNSGEIIALYQPLRRTARAVAPGRAEDLVQETLLALLRRLENGAEIENLRAYAGTTLRNLARRAPQLSTGEDPDAQPAPPSGHFALSQVLAALRTLPSEQSSLLIACLRGLSYAEMAQASGLPRGTIMSRLSRARKALRQRLGLRQNECIEGLLDQ